MERSETACVLLLREHANLSHSSLAQQGQQLISGKQNPGFETTLLRKTAFQTRIAMVAQVCERAFQADKFSFEEKLPATGYYTWFLFQRLFHCCKREKLLH